MTYCRVCYSDASLVCSGCKTYRYCSEKCQTQDWKDGHKKICKFQQVINAAETEAKAKADLEPPERPAAGRCTGCNVKFSRNHYCEDECAECGYQTCESCASHHSKGTCYCPGSNFGNLYCEMEPRWYHADGRNGSSYRGDRHPDPTQCEYSDEHFEDEPRKCSNCDNVAFMLKPEFARAR